MRWHVVGCDRRIDDRVLHADGCSAWFCCVVFVLWLAGVQERRLSALFCAVNMHTAVVRSMIAHSYNEFLQVNCEQLVCFVCVCACFFVTSQKLCIYASVCVLTMVASKRCCHQANGNKWTVAVLRGDICSQWSACSRVGFAVGLVICVYLVSWLLASLLSVLCPVCHKHTYMSSSYSSLDWVLSHWAHFTVPRFVCVFCVILSYCICVVLL